MPSVLYHSSLIFPLISIFGIYAVSNLMIHSGLYDAFNASQVAKPRVLPDGRTPLQTLYTGLGPLDDYLSNLQYIFTDLITGSSPQLSLFGLHFAGVIFVIITVMLVETLRTRRQRDLFSFICWTLAIQYCGYFVTMPLYCYVHLISSRDKMTAKPTEDQSSTVLAVPLSIAIGYVFPSVVMCLDIHSGLSRQYAIAFWQNFPIWVAIVQLSIQTAIAARKEPVPKEFSASKEPVKYKVHGAVVKQVYWLTMAIASLVHVIGIVPIVWAKFWPESLAPDLSHSLQPGEFLVPPIWNSDLQIISMGEGAWNFLRYDYYIGTIAALFWAIMLSYDAQRSRINRQRIVIWVMMIVLSTIFIGPGATIAILMIERENTI